MTTDAGAAGAAPREPHVLISYAHTGDVPEKVSRLADDLCEVHEINVVIDQYELPNGPDEGWTCWMERMLRDAEYIVCVCTPDWVDRVERRVPIEVGNGVKWEGSLIRNMMYRSGGVSSRIVLVQLEGEVYRAPDFLGDRHYHALPRDMKNLVDTLQGKKARRPTRGARKQDANAGGVSAAETAKQVPLASETVGRSRPEAEGRNDQRTTADLQTPAEAERSVPKQPSRQPSAARPHATAAAPPPAPAVAVPQIAAPPAAAPPVAVAPPAAPSVIKPPRPAPPAATASAPVASPVVVVGATPPLVAAPPRPTAPALGLLDAPPWAAAAGADQHGRWADIDVGGVTQRMRWIEPGRFLMGTPAAKRVRDPGEHPEHEVRLSRGYWLGDTPVTQALYLAVMGENPSFFTSPPDPRRPVEMVSWTEAVAFTRRLAALRATDAVDDGEVFQLPSEAQWEYACRAGTGGPTYAAPGQRLVDLAWFEANANGGSAPVAQRAPNPWGLYDALGNVSEWCADAPRRYGPGRPGLIRFDPLGGVGLRRACRGGGWRAPERSVRAAARDASSQSFRNSDLGFRLSRGAAHALAEPKLP